MKFYNVFQNPDVLSEDDYIFLKEGLSLFALFLPLFFSIYNGLWKTSIFLLVYFSIIISLYDYFKILNPIIFMFILTPHIIFSFEAREFVKKSLIKKGWRNLGLVCGSNIAEAEIKFYNIKNSTNIK
tara:strand:- start:32 stop:412 length:381 start_codon:yes stop_codon:yes gene_type:complete